VKQNYPPALIDEIIRMAWADEISFDRIKREKGIAESEVIKIMRGNLKPRSFKLWRERVTGRKSKHEKRTKLIESLPKSES
jgi:uncharacterized protein (TIGR03643 family)